MLLVADQNFRGIITILSESPTKNRKATTLGLGAANGTAQPELQVGLSPENNLPSQQIADHQYIGKYSLQQQLSQQVSVAAELLWHSTVRRLLSSRKPSHWSSNPAAVGLNPLHKRQSFKRKLLTRFVPKVGQKPLSFLGPHRSLWACVDCLATGMGGGKFCMWVHSNIGTSWSPQIFCQPSDLCQ